MEIDHSDSVSCPLKNHGPVEEQVQGHPQWYLELNLVQVVDILGIDKEIGYRDSPSGRRGRWHGWGI